MNPGQWHRLDNVFAIEVWSIRALPYTPLAHARERVGVYATNALRSLLECVRILCRTGVLRTDLDLDGPRAGAIQRHPAMEVSE